MSLEQAINDHAAAIRELAAAISGAATANITTKGPAAAKTEVKADTKPTTAKAAVEQALASAAEAKAKKEAEAAAAAAAAAAENTDDPAGGDAAPVLDYDTDVKPKFQAFLKAKGRDAGLALLGKYSAKSGAELPKDRLHEVLADIEAAG